MKKQKMDKKRKTEEGLWACLETAVPFRFLIETALFILFQNGEVIFTAETVTQQNGPIFAKQGLIQ